MIVSTVTGKAYEGVKHSADQKLVELLGKHTFVKSPHISSMVERFSSEKDARVRVPYML